MGILALRIHGTSRPLYHLPVHLERRAFAKVNLALAVGPAQPPDPGTGSPGLHPIASWMHAVDLFDSISLTWLGEHHAPRFEVGWAADAMRSSPIDWPPEKDLALRALRLMEQSLGRSLPVSIRVEKRIPVGGGLGGGSSDAAAVLVGVRDLLSLAMTDAQLAALSARLGSDIAYFIGGPADGPPAPALVTGLGDRVERLPRRWADREIVLVFPPFGCPTGPVYKAFDALPRGDFRDVAVKDLVKGEGGMLFNDLLPAAERVQPALGPLRERLARAVGLPVFMSGSGSTLFVLPDVGRTGGEVAAKIAAESSDMSVLATRLV